MSFNTTEISNDDGRPIFLYSFSLGSATWRFTSSDSDVIIGGYKWTAVPISDDGVKVTGDANTDSVSITAPNTIAPVSLFIGTPPSAPFIVRIFHYHEGDTDSVLAYMGEVQQVNQPEPGRAVITCDSISISMQRDGLRLGWQRTCGYALYDPTTCKADKAANELTFKVYDVIGNDVYLQGADDLDDDVLTGGYMQWVNPLSGIEYRGIEVQKQNVCTMFGLADGIYYGLEVKAYPGCDRKVATCTSKFNNLDNYGGVPDMPGKSPFDGDPVF